MSPTRQADPNLRGPPLPQQPIDHFLPFLALRDLLKDGPHSLRFSGVDLQSPTLRIHIIPKYWAAPQPFPLPPRRPHLVPRPLGDELPFELSKTQENIQRQPPQ